MLKKKFKEKRVPRQEKISIFYLGFSQDAVGTAKEGLKIALVPPVKRR